MSEEVSTAAREAIRIAEKYLPDEPLEKRKALAKAIVEAITLCETEFGNVIIRSLGNGAVK